MANLFQGKIWPAAMQAVSKALNAGKGLPPSVLSKVANALMEADPNTARALLEAGRSSAATSAGRKSWPMQFLTPWELQRSPDASLLCRADYQDRDCLKEGHPIRRDAASGKRQRIR